MYAVMHHACMHTYIQREGERLSCMRGASLGVGAPQLVHTHTHTHKHREGDGESRLGVGVCVCLCLFVCVCGASLGVGAPQLVPWPVGRPPLAEGLRHVPGHEPAHGAGRRRGPGARGRSGHEPPHFLSEAAEVRSEPAGELRPRRRVRAGAHPRPYPRSHGGGIEEVKDRLG